MDRVNRGALADLGGWIVADISTLEYLGRKDRWSKQEREQVRALMMHLQEYTDKLTAWAKDKGIGTE